MDREGPSATLAADPAAPARDDGVDRGRASVDPSLTPHTADEPALRRAHLEYIPALDGLRGVAVAAVLLFHGGFAWARGGYLGVSTFFTLSGFLITSLLLAEHHRTGRIDLRAFWARRLRRLLPASLVTLAAVMGSVVLTSEGWERSLPGDVVAAVLQVANWRFLFDDRAYADLFELPSPVLHFWSLAIEEQFYWLFPLLAAGVLAVTRGSLRAFLAVIGALVGVAAILTVVYRDAAETVYYATPIRMGEILVGAVLAVLMTLHRDRLLDGAGVRRLLPVLGALALVVSVVAWVRVDQANPWISNGGLLAYSVVSTVLVWAACLPGTLSRLLAFEPLRLLGVVSYGVYLIHWPVFLVLSTERTDRLLSPLGLEPRGWWLFGLKVTVTLVLAVVSYRLVEMPIRRGRRPRRLPGATAAVGGMAVVLLLAWVVPRFSPPPEDAFEVAARHHEDQAVHGPDPAALGPNSQVGVTLGDSTMLLTAMGLSQWGEEDHHRLVLTSGSGGLGCGVGRGGERIYQGARGPVAEDCDWEPTLPRTIAASRDRYGDRLTFAIVQTGPWDFADRKLPGDDRWRAIGDPIYDEFLRGELAAATNLLLDEGLTVVWLTAPPVESGNALDPPPAEPFPESDPARAERLNEMIRELAADHPDVVVVDLAGWLASLPEAEQDRLRPDGIHFTSFTDGDFTALEVADRYLGDAVLDALEERTR